jgi:hypothetical protein
VRRALLVYLVSTSPQPLFRPLSCLVQEGEDIVCLGGTSTAHAAAHVEYGGYGSSVIEDAANSAYRSTTPHQPLFHRNQFNSCLPLHVLHACQNSNGFLDMAKQRPALVKDRPRFKDAYSKALGDDWVFDKDGKMHVTVGRPTRARSCCQGRFFPCARRACGRDERPRREYWKFEGPCL